MPIFDYRCPICSIIEEHLVSNPDILVMCKKCSTDMDKQIPSKFSFNLKGDGFHKQGFDSYKGPRC